jgi:poly-beta-1,6-N-acetyl-D-glucosamine N-deacetylase
MRRIVFLLIRLTGIPFFLREFVQRRRVTILCYHDPDPEIADLHIRVLKRLYNIIPLSAYINARSNPEAEALPIKPLVITFDDGHMRNHKLLPVFKQHQVPFTIFLCSGIVGTHRHYWWNACVDHKMTRFLKQTTNQDRLARLAEIGYHERSEFSDRQSLSHSEIEELRIVADLQAHTRFHPILPQCTNERAWDEIAGSKADLERDYGLNIYAFAYPNGDYSDRDAEFAQRAGYACALTIDGGYNTTRTDMFRLKRVRMYDLADVDELIVKASGLWGFWERIQNRGTYGYMRTPGPATSRIHEARANTQID